MPDFQIELTVEQWRLKHPFVVSRRSTQTVDTLRVRLSAEGVVGQGESSGLYYVGETLDGMLAQVRAFTERTQGRFGFDEVLALMPANGARSALDCALWDWFAKRSGTPAWRAAGLDTWMPLRTDITLSRDTPQAMADAARRHPGFSMLKLKVGGDGPLAQDLARIEAVREAVGPEVGFIVDPNTAWSVDDVVGAGPQLQALGVCLLEQPIAPGHEGNMRAAESAVPLCADESITDCRSLETLHPVYRAINIKLDKTGGLTEALRLRRLAASRGYRVMVGCMNGTSLSIAPGTLVAQGADFVDLDTHLDLIEDRPFALAAQAERLSLPDARLWG